MAKIAIEGI